MRVFGIDVGSPGPCTALYCFVKPLSPELLLWVNVRDGYYEVGVTVFNEALFGRGGGDISGCGTTLHEAEDSFALVLDELDEDHTLTYELVTGAIAKAQQAVKDPAVDMRHLFFTDRQDIASLDAQFKVLDEMVLQVFPPKD